MSRLGLSSDGTTIYSPVNLGIPIANLSSEPNTTITVEDLNAQAISFQLKKDASGQKRIYLDAVPVPGQKIQLKFFDPNSMYCNSEKFHVIEFSETYSEAIVTKFELQSFGKRRIDQKNEYDPGLCGGPSETNQDELMARFSFQSSSPAMFRLIAEDPIYLLKVTQDDSISVDSALFAWNFADQSQVIENRCMRVHQVFADGSLSAALSRVCSDEAKDTYESIDLNSTLVSGNTGCASSRSNHGFWFTLLGCLFLLISKRKRVQDRILKI